VAAQWPKYTTPNVPRLADGAVDLNAPTPRTPDGKPDLSGQWGRPPGGARGANAVPPAPPPGTPPLATFFDVGAGFPEGLPFQPWAAELKKQRNATNSKDNPDALCLPMGHMQFHMHGQPRVMIQQPTLITVLYEANYGQRFIHTDGRPLPPQGGPRRWYGYRWTMGRRHAGDADQQSSRRAGWTCGESVPEQAGSSATADRVSAVSRSTSPSTTRRRTRSLSPCG
jgi:hypothetical protein